MLPESTPNEPAKRPKPKIRLAGESIESDHTLYDVKPIKSDGLLPTQSKPPVQLVGGGRDGGLKDRWDSTVAAEDPLPDGDYVAHAVNSTFMRSPKDGTEGLEVEFAVLQGDHVDR